MEEKVLRNLILPSNSEDKDTSKWKMSKELKDKNIIYLEKVQMTRSEKSSEKYILNLDIVESTLCYHSFNKKKKS